MGQIPQGSKLLTHTALPSAPPLRPPSLPPAGSGYLENSQPENHRKRMAKPQDPDDQCTSDGPGNVFDAKTHHAA